MNLMFRIRGANRFQQWSWATGNKTLPLVGGIKCPSGTEHARAGVPALARPVKWDYATRWQGQ